MLNDVRIQWFLPLSLLIMAASTGCHRTAASVTAKAAHPSAQQMQQTEEARQEMDLIPPPSKSRYMAVKSLSGWENPYITVQGSMLTLHVLLADANTSGLGEGGLLRPVGARRQDLNIRVSDLPAALSAVPQDSWPYGRVVAVEEAHNIPPSARPQVRRNVETAMQALNDLGVVVYEWNDNSSGLQ
jgi:hypothetical protein